MKTYNKNLATNLRSYFSFGRKVEEWAEAPVTDTTAEQEVLLDELTTFEAPLELGAPLEFSNFYSDKDQFFLLTIASGPHAGEYLVNTEGYDYARYITRIVRSV